MKKRRKKHIMTVTKRS